jgi:hypothetical protein
MVNNLKIQTHIRAGNPKHVLRKLAPDGVKQAVRHPKPAFFYTEKKKILIKC